MGDHRSSFGSVYRKRRRDGSEYDGWYVRYVEAGERRERFGGLTKEQAEAFLAARRVEKVVARITGEPPVRRVKLKEWRDDAVKEFERTCRPRGMPSRKVQIRHFVKRYGDRDVCDVRPDDVREHLRWLRDEREYANTSLHNALRVIASLFRLAANRGLCRVPPTKGLLRELPAIETEEMPFLEPAELRRVYAAMPAEIRPCVILMGEAGLRRNEAIGLLWSEVAPDRSRVSIRGRRAKGRKFRPVPLTDLAASTLKTLHEARGAIPLRGEDRVFDFKESFLDTRFRAARDSLPGLEWLTPHGLRHAFGSGLVRAGVDLATVQRLLGHRDIKTTMRYASHAPTSAEADAIGKLQASRQAPPPATRAAEST